ncbi:DeoR family transcriptional regulator [Rhodobacteraceae bacterium 2CG4]|uniref:DeoR family transcriptional regulator n=1 Tax=Halovulum marinum TaxID=2662447 RepID=A0A6L5Z2T1_9RHOB|nr:DeoR/GlpR family DNA-binding transcription regulator [Halovulum marinum]MSU90837.1 DeoR family transcriptional regulator [Halovulum marinum]
MLDPPKHADSRKPERLPASLRQARILHAFEESTFVTIGELARIFNVSAMTIRRDLDALDRQGLLERTRGGALPPVRDAQMNEPAFDMRRQESAGQKVTIAKAGAALVGEGMSLGIDVGTTTLALAEKLGSRRDIRVITSSLRAATYLAGRDTPVYTLAGQVRTPELSITGPQAVDSVKSHFLDIAFIGVAALDEYGFYDYSPEDSEVKRAFMANAAKVVALCDSSKFERRAFSRVSPLSQVNVLITDAMPPSAIADALARAKVEICVA